jgi:HSP20 family protein
MTKFFTKLTGNGNNNPPVMEPGTDNFDDVSENELLPKSQELKEEWLDKENVEGQLTVDVFQTKDDLVIKSTIAGVKPEDIDISIDNDVITIRGQRKYEEEVKEENYFYQECYWGSFSRSIVLPIEVKADETQAALKNGVLTITIPKTQKSKSVAIKVKSE